MSFNPVHTVLIVSGLIAAAGPVGSYALDHPTLDKTIICGYQGWFACYGDGSPVERWNHWSGGAYRSDIPKPAPGYQKFEVYPSITDYASDNLYQTGYAPLGDGRPATLFSSYPSETIDLHGRWMQEAGIDGVALQRFLGELQDGVYKAHRDSVTVRLMRAAEKYDRMFYIMYDGVGNDIDGLIADWQNTMVNTLHVTDSPRYAYQDGKPVVCIWGFGFSHYTDTAANALRAVTWFRDHGCYVIGGVPTNWRTGTSDSKAGYEAVYHAFDMLSPWTPGRYRLDVEVDSYKSNFLIPDKNSCDSSGIVLQPVIFPGFAWSNWNGGDRNAFPRNQGRFMWRQFRNAFSLGVKCMYVAMFDEYDEGTAIAKAAVDWFDVPTDQYFQTMSIDGTFLSSDFYLRLTGAATKVLRGTAPDTTAVPIRPSEGPLWFRSGFEPVDARLSWIDTPDTLKNVGGVGGSDSARCRPDSGTAKSGMHSIRISGSSLSTESSSIRFQGVDVSIPISVGTMLTYALCPSNANGRHISVDLLMSDESSLKTAPIADSTGIDAIPAQGHGTVGTWTTITIPLGKQLSGKTISRIDFVYENSGASGEFIGTIDNLIIEDRPYNETATRPSSNTTITPTPAMRSDGSRISLTGDIPHPEATLNFITLQGRTLRSIPFDHTQFSVDLPSGILIVTCVVNGIERWRTPLTIIR